MLANRPNTIWTRPLPQGHAQVKNIFLNIGQAISNRNRTALVEIGWVLGGHRRGFMYPIASCKKPFPFENIAVGALGHTQENGRYIIFKLTIFYHDALFRFQATQSQNMFPWLNYMHLDK